MPRFLPRLVTFDGEPYRDYHGVLITPHGSFADFPEPDIVMIPDLTISPHEPVPNTFAPIADWIRSTYERGAIVASMCSGTVLLSETGLLDGRGGDLALGLLRRHQGAAIPASSCARSGCSCWRATVIA